MNSPHLRNVSRTDFPTQLKSKMVRIDRETTLGVTVGAKLPRRAVVKEQQLGQVCLQQIRHSPIKT